MNSEMMKKNKEEKKKIDLLSFAEGQVSRKEESAEERKKERQCRIRSRLLVFSRSTFNLVPLYTTFSCTVLKLKQYGTFKCRA